MSDADQGSVHIPSMSEAQHRLVERREPGIAERGNGKPSTWRPFPELWSQFCLLKEWQSTPHSRRCRFVVLRFLQPCVRGCNTVMVNGCQPGHQTYLVGCGCLGHGVGCIQVWWERVSWWVAGICHGHRVLWDPWQIFGISVLRDASLIRLGNQSSVTELS